MTYIVEGLIEGWTPQVLDTTHSPVGLWLFDDDLTDEIGNDDFALDNGTIQWTLGHEHGRNAVHLQDNSVRLMGTVPAPAPMLIQGDVTLQLVFMMSTTVGIDSFGSTLFSGAATQGGTTGEVNNDLYTLMLDNVANRMVPRFTWEYGAGLRESVLSTDYRIALGQWYHLVGIRETEGAGLCTGRLYLNGQLIAEEAGLNEATGGTGGSNRNWIGRDPNGAGLGWLGGAMSSAKVVASALTAAQVAAEYQRVVGGQL